MKIILGNPGSGKTKALLALSADTNTPILAESGARVERLLVKAKGYGVEIPTPITLEEIDDTVTKVLVDDLERLFAVALKVQVEAVTLNRDSNYEVVDLDKN